MFTLRVISYMSGESPVTNPRKFHSAALTMASSPRSEHAVAQRTLRGPSAAWQPRAAGASRRQKLSSDLLLAGVAQMPLCKERRMKNVAAQQPAPAEFPADDDSK